MLYREVIAVCSEIHTKHINTLCGQNVELLNVKPAVRKETAGLWKVNMWTVWNKNPQHVGGHGCLSVVIVVCCQVEVSATNWSLVQRCPTDCGASLSVI
jgi:hypothetical protein